MHMSGHGCHDIVESCLVKTSLKPLSCKTPSGYVRTEQVANKVINNYTRYSFSFATCFPKVLEGINDVHFAIKGKFSS